MTTTTALRIRYANTDTVPATYGSAGYRTDVVMVDDYWTLRGSVYALARHVERALSDNNLNDYYWM